MAQENEKIEQENIPVVEIKTEKKFKQPSIKVILISIISLLVIILIIGILLIVFSPKEEQETAETSIQNQETLVKEEPKDEPKEEEIKFDLSGINSQKLNEQLENLTNKFIQKEQINSEEAKENRRVLEEQKRIEEESLKIEEEIVSKQKESLDEKKTLLEEEMKKLEALKEEALLAKQELLKIQNSNNQEVEKETKEENIVENKKSIEESTSNNSDVLFLKLINVAKIKGVLYKKYLDKATSLDPNIHLCRDDLNRIELYYGPFETLDSREVLLNRLIKNGFSQAYELEMTKEEFDARCNY
jgi:hypothetical protein